MQPHTKAKHDILITYLKRWYPIMATYNDKILYLDGFAGCGLYDDGSLGSPILAIDIANDHSLREKLAQKELIFRFVEIDKKRVAFLEKMLNDRYTKTPGDNYNYAKLGNTWTAAVTEGEFNTTFEPLLKQMDIDGKRLVPTLAFIDPFGYSDLDVDVLGHILKYQKCELFITYMVGFLDRFSFEEKHVPSILKTLRINRAELDRIKAITDDEKRELEWMRHFTNGIIQSMKNLDSNLPVPYHLYFRVKDAHNKPLYNLVYFTKNERGLEEMKESMWKIGSEGSYIFSDFDFSPGQTTLLDYSKEKPWHDQAGAELTKHFSKQTVTVGQIQSFIARTYFIWRKGILVNLEEDKKIQFFGKRNRPFTYPNNDDLIKFLI
jgi:three-Cys-motif partner protein